MSKLKFKLFYILGVVTFYFNVSVNLAHAETLVVTSQNSPYANIDLRLAKKLWMGKKKRINGTKVSILDQVDGNSAQTEFYQSVMGKNSNEMKAYWAKLVFTGSAFPPRKLDGDTKIKEWLATHPDTIGYIKADSLDDSVRVLLEVK